MNLLGSDQITGGISEERPREEVSSRRLEVSSRRGPAMLDDGSLLDDGRLLSSSGFKHPLPINRPTNPNNQSHFTVTRAFVPLEQSSMMLG